MKKNYYRRQFPVINRSLQYKFLAIVLSYGFITAALLALSLFLPDVINMNNQDLSPEIRGAAAQRILTLHSRIWPAILTVVCILGIHSFRVFLKIVGPLYRFRWAFTEIGKGNLNFRIKLRRKDYLSLEAEKLNEMVDILTDKWENMRLAGLDSIESFYALEKSVIKSSDWHEKNHQLLQTHRKHLKILMDQIQYFRPVPDIKVEQNTPGPKRESLIQVS